MLKFIDNKTNTDPYITHLGLSWVTIY